VFSATGDEISKDAMLRSSIEAKGAEPFGATLEPDGRAEEERPDQSIFFHLHKKLEP